MISEHKIVPKESITELQLAEKFGMSRTPIRESLRQLKAEGYLIPHNKRGYFLNIPSIKEIKDLYEIRVFLEGGAAKLAAKEIDLDYLENFEKQFISLKDKDREVDDDEKIVGLGRKFHFFIMESSGNQELKKMVEKLYGQLEISRMFSYGTRGRKAIDEHLKIIGALKERDGEKSQIYMEEHLKNAFNTLVGTL